MTLMLAGKSALVTGGASGIGRATALAMAREGALVAVADRTEELAAGTVALINQTGGQAIAIGCDVAQSGQVEAMVARALAAFGRIDCAFNNAGISPRLVGPAGQLVHELSEESWNAMVGVNLTGVFLCMRAEIPHMLSQGGGAIVNTASILGLVGTGTASSYVAAKHGVVGLTRAAAADYATAGVRVNCVCPGYIETPMTTETVRERGEALMAKVPQKRLGQPTDIAEAVVWLCSDRAGFVTGHAQVVDGGYTAI